MQDIIQASLERIRQAHLDGLDLGEGNLAPAYDGLSILNLPASVCAWLGAPPLPHPRIDLSALETLAEGVEQVIVTLIDAVALHRFERWFTGSPLKAELQGRPALFSALTSIVPSTTSAALTSLWTGRSPAEHGVLGYEIFLREFGMIANMITHAPAAFNGNAGLLYEGGFDPLHFLPVPTLGPALKEAGVESHAFLHYSIGRSGLSRMHYPQVEVHPFGGVGDLWIGVRHLAEMRRASRRFIWVYYGGVDGLSHRYGPDSEQAEIDFKAFLRAMQETFVGPSAGSLPNTLVLLLADHGQILTPKEARWDLQNHPGFNELLHFQPTGENRLAYLHVKPDRSEDVQAYLEAAWPGSFQRLPSAEALQRGLFGPGEPAPSAADRLGEHVLLSQQEAYLWWARKENPLLGRHGGLSEQEMLVPLLAFRL